MKLAAMKASKSRHFEKLMFAYSFFELMFCSGPIFGWASLAYVLKMENYFSESCTGDSKHNISSIVTNSLCPDQENRLNIAYTVGFLTVGLASFPVGCLLDICGPKIARYTSRWEFGCNFIKFRLNVDYLWPISFHSARAIVWKEFYDIMKPKVKHAFEN